MIKKNVVGYLSTFPSKLGQNLVCHTLFKTLLKTWLMLALFQTFTPQHYSTIYTYILLKKHNNNKKIMIKNNKKKKKKKLGLNISLQYPRPYSRLHPIPFTLSTLLHKSQLKTLVRTLLKTCDNDSLMPTYAVII